MYEMCYINKLCLAFAICICIYCCSLLRMSLVFLFHSKFSLSHLLKACSKNHECKCKCSQSVYSEEHEHVREHTVTAFILASWGLKATRSSLCLLHFSCSNFTYINLSQILLAHKCLLSIVRSCLHAR